MLKHGILGLLNYQAMTGYEIMEVFRDSLHYFWDAKTSQIYRELQGLEQKEWVGKTVVPQSGKPDKNVYADLGLRMKTPVLMKVFFLGERSAGENIGYFERIKEQCERFLASMDPIPQSIEAYGELIGQKEQERYWQMTVEYGRRMMRMQIEWAQDCIRRLEEE